MKIENGININKGSSILIKRGLDPQIVQATTDCFGCREGLILTEITMGGKAEKLACPSCGHLHSFQFTKTGRFSQVTKKK